MIDTATFDVAHGGHESRLATARGAMLYDASCVGHPDEDLFEPDRWRARGALEELAGGRGRIAFMRHDGRRWVLRHYRRGGAVAAVLGDRYLWTGEDRTRAFREWRLLRTLAERSLPAPRAIAARYVRRGVCYSADLITEELPSRVTLAAALGEAALPDRRWTDIGRCIHAFHAHGVCHADLNAHNVVLGADDAVYLIDFDRGRIRRRGAWESAVLARLRRSLDKVTVALSAHRFGERQWRLLRDAATGG